MKRMTHAETEAAAVAKDRARVILKLYVQRWREESQAKSAPSMTAIVIDVLRLGCITSSSPELGSLHMSSRQRWLVNVDWILRQIGNVDAALLIARLTRREKSVEASYATIATELHGALGVELIEHELRARFAVALARFLALLDERGIDRHCSEESATSVSYQHLPTAARAAVQDRLVHDERVAQAGDGVARVAALDVLRLVGAATIGKIRMQTVVRRLRKSTRIVDSNRGGSVKDPITYWRAQEVKAIAEGLIPDFHKHIEEGPDIIYVLPLKAR